MRSFPAVYERIAREPVLVGGLLVAVGDAIVSDGLSPRTVALALCSFVVRHFTVPARDVYPVVKNSYLEDDDAEWP